MLAAFYIAGIDNAIVEINTEEVPVDGSAKDFLEVIKLVELVNQLKKRKYLKISNKIDLVDGKEKFRLNQTVTLLK